MEKLYTEDKKNFLVYHKEETLKNKAPYVIFLHGLMSNMNGAKAVATKEYCISKGYNFIRFDNFGHGSSSGEFTEFTISDWLDGVNMVISQLTTGPVVLVGSSMGAWLAMLATIMQPAKIIGIVTLAAAIDFTEKLIWDNLTNDKKHEMKKKGVLQIASDNCAEGFPITYGLIIDGRKHLLLDSHIDISCPVCLIHGMKDSDASYKISLQTSKLLKSQHVVVKLIKDGEHRLSRKEDLIILYNSLDEIHSRTFNK